MFFKIVSTQILPHTGGVKWVIPIIALKMTSNFIYVLFNHYPYIILRAFYAMCVQNKFILNLQNLKSYIHRIERNIAVTNP